MADSRNTIFPLSALLQLPMPMKRSSLFRAVDVVVNGDCDHIAPIGFNLRRRVLTVDENDIAKDAVGRDPRARNGKVVVAGDIGLGNVARNSGVGILGRPIAPWSGQVWRAVLLREPLWKTALTQGTVG